MLAEFVRGDVSPSGEPYLFARGGSTLGAFQTSTSDVDLFAISVEQDQGWLAQACHGWPRIDLEFRSDDWLRRTCGLLDNYRSPVVPSPPEISFWDLRFMARCALGERVFGSAQLHDEFIRRKDSLRLTLLAHASADFVNIYEDLFGLYLGMRTDEIFIRAGELLQAACRLALLNTSLVDPAPKWAISQMLTCGIRPLNLAAACVITHLRRTNLAPLPWSEQLLRLANSLVAMGWLQCDREEPSQQWSSSQRVDLFWCFPGLPRAFTVLDLRDRSVNVVNRSFVEAIAASGLYVEVTADEQDFATRRSA